MNIVYFGNTLNRHQVYVADALYQLTGEEYTYVETVPPTEENKSGGKVRIDRPYVLRAYENETEYRKAMNLSRNNDVALFGADSFPFEIERLKMNNKLSFEVSERPLKRGMRNLASPFLLKKMWYYHTLNWARKSLYKLCASAYCANDQYLLHSFKNKCYKWGYFTDVDPLRERDIKNKKMNLSTTNIMWCARFLDWKHPELAIHLAERLKKSGYSFVLDMYGSGKLLEQSQTLARQLQVDDVVSFCGNVSNDYILQEMYKHDVFLFTSDRREGWGAVLNEAMSNGCAVVASNEIGAVPFLIKDGINGLIFKSKSVSSLYDKVVSLIEAPTWRFQLSVEAYRTMRDQWSPIIAAQNLHSLCRQLLQGINSNKIKSGPCSMAFPI